MVRPIRMKTPNVPASSAVADCGAGVNSSRIRSQACHRMKMRRGAILAKLRYPLLSTIGS